MMDRWFRWLEAIPLKEIKTEDFVSVFIREWVSRYDVPLHLTCDRGTQFTSDLLRAVTSLLRTKIIHTKVYVATLKQNLKEMQPQLFYWKRKGILFTNQR